MPLHIQSESAPNSKQLIDDYVRSKGSGVLATTGADNVPHAAVVYYGVEDDLSLTFGTKVGTTKHQHLQANKNVALVVYDEVAQTSLQVFGRAEEITDEDQVDRVAANMYARSAEISGRELPPAEKLYAGDYAAYRLVPGAMVMAVYARPDSGQDSLFEKLTFGED